MKRIVALDCGDSWIGVAHTDMTQTIVIPHTTWKTKNINQDLKDYLHNNPVECIVVGLPLALKNNHSQQTKKVIEFTDNLKLLFPQYAFHFQDERLSSQFAQNQKNFFNIKHTPEKSEHAHAAAIILESFLQRTKNK